MQAWHPGGEYTLVDEFTEKLNISINGLRYLPSNISITKVSCMIFKASSKSWFKSFQIDTLSSVDEPCFMPTFSTSSKIAIADLNDKSCVLLIKIYTLEIMSRELQLVGFSFINLFRDRETKKMPLTKKHDNSIPNCGYFQLPIISSQLTKPELKAISGGFDVMAPRLPCGSILISILEENVSDLSPPYESGKYHTDLQFLPLDFEMNLFPFVFLERKIYSVRDRLLSLGDIPRTATQTQEALVIWASKQFEFTKSELPPLLNISQIAIYDPHYGFKLSIDQAFNLGVRGFSFYVISFCNNIFDINIDTLNSTFKDDFKYSNNLDFTSELRNPVWNDGYHWYRHRSASINSCAVIHIYGIPDDEYFPISLEGWTVMPIFFSPSYVRHGRFQLPLFEGEPTAEAIEYWHNGNRLLEEAIEDKALSFTDRKASIVMKICDGRRSSEITNDSQVQLDFMVPFASKFKSASFSSSIISIKPKKLDEDEFKRSYFSRFIEATRLPFVP
jgi:hypothetical protein